MYESFAAGRAQWSLTYGSRGRARPASRVLRASGLQQPVSEVISGWSVHDSELMNK